METHLKNVEAELEAAGRRAAAKAAQIATEEHLLQLSQRVEGKAAGELKGPLAFAEKECKGQLHAVKAQVNSNCCWKKYRKVSHAKFDINNNTTDRYLSRSFGAFQDADELEQ